MAEKNGNQHVWDLVGKITKPTNNYQLPSKNWCWTVFGISGMGKSSCCDPGADTDSNTKSQERRRETWAALRSPAKSLTFSELNGNYH